MTVNQISQRNYTVAIVRDGVNRGDGNIDRAEIIGRLLMQE